MSLKKKKNIVVLTLCMVTSFILYQLYFFLTITSETSNGNRVIPVLDGSAIREVIHLRSDADKFINENGVIRGVSQQSMVRYRPDSNNQFKCLNSEQRITFERVNDDYCDCEDGTDEPSTDACVNGIFNCDSFQKKPVTFRTDSVPSSRVNDGICDCCDGSDEWIYEPNRKVLTLGSAQFYRQYADKCQNVC